VLLAAVDSAAAALSNTRAVARAHYVRPQVIACFADDRAGELLKRSSPPSLRPAERRLAGLLNVLFAEEFGS